MGSYLDRTIKMLGEDKINSLKNKRVLVAGLGGVGGTALEALARSGINNFVIVDFDNVDESNLNRQILYLYDDIGLEKVGVAKKRMLDINPNLNIEVLSMKIDAESISNFPKDIDFIVDAIDYIPGKLAIYKFAIKNKIPFISSLGMGNRIDPTQVMITKLNQTEGDPLARKIRYECKSKGIDLSKINVVFSKETPLIKSKEPGSMMMVPSTAGLLMAKYVIETIK